MGVLREFTCDLHHHFRFHTSVLLLPCGGVRQVLVVRRCRVATTQTVLYAVVSQHQVEYRGYQRGTAISQLHTFSRHFTVNHGIVFTAKVSETYVHHFVRTLFQAQRQVHVFLLCTGFQVPFLATIPTETYRAVRHAQRVRSFIPSQHFPFWVFVFPEMAIQLRSAQEVFRHIALVIRIQTHQHRHVG